MKRQRPDPTTIILILGMHRSGTSALARVLNLCGASLGRDLIPAKEDNERGFWENQRILALHEKLLAALGLRWHDVAALPADWTGGAAAREFRRELGAVLHEQFGDSRLLVVKDPRLSLLAPLWLEVLRERSIRPTFAVTVRDPNEVAASLARRDNLPPVQSCTLWLQHLVDAERASRGHPRLFVRYESLLQDWQAQLQRVAQQLDVEWPVQAEDAATEISAFLSPALRHHRGTTAQAAPSLVQRAYAVACAAAEDERVQWPQVEREYDAGVQLFGPVLREASARARRDIETLSAEIDAARQAHNERDVTESALREAVAAREHDIEQARRNIDTLAAQIADARDAHEARDITEAALRESLAARERDVDQARQNIDALAAQIADARRAHEARDITEAALRESLAARERDIDQARQNIDRLATQIGQAQQNIEGLTAQIGQAQQNIEGLTAQIDDARRAHAARDEIEASLRREIDSARHNIDELAGQIENARSAHDARDVTERILREEVAALRASRWFRLGRAFGIMRAPRQPECTAPAPIPASAAAQPEWSVARPTVPDGMHFAIESPLADAEFEGELRVGGWCFSESGPQPAIRVRVDGRDSSVPSRIARGDVAVAYPDFAEAANSGFDARFSLPAGAYLIHVEVAAADGDWQPLGTRAVTVRAVPLRASLDTPGDMRASTGTIRLSGWCVHPTLRVADLRIAAGVASVNCRYGLERGDVADALPDAPGAANSGFEASIELGPGTWPVRLIAVLEDASEVEMTWPQPLRVKNQPLHQQLHRRVALGIGLVRFGLRESRNWVANNRRLPRAREIVPLIRMGLELFRARQPSGPTLAAPNGFRLSQPMDSYAAWQEVNRFNEPSRTDLQRRLEAALSPLPSLSIVMPVYNPPLELLEAAVESVRSQVYANWELCIADDASSAPGVREFLQELAADDARVRLCLRSENGNISLATNSAAQLARGEFIVLLDQDDLLTPDALAEIALCAAAQPLADIIYSDDDKIAADGRRFAPQFKPDWSPELLLGYMYFSHVFCVRRELYAKIGGMRIGFEGSQDYDFALRATEQARAIAHVPQVLYHWRVLPGSTAASGAAKPASFDAGLRAVNDALQRRGTAASAQQPDWARKASVGIFSIEFPDDGPKVSIIIPTRNALPVLRRCIESLSKTTYRNFEVIVIDNESDDPATLEYLTTLPHRVERITNPNGRFNFAHINNRAAQNAAGEVLLFLNNDTEVIAPRWLSQMVGYASFAGVGAVGARLLFPDRRIQHAGIVHGYYGGLAGPAFKLSPEWDNGYLSYARVSRTYSAVTAACLLTPRRIFLELGGFDEVNFEVAYNDVDYCYRLGERGLRSVYCADAELLHHEGHSRGFFDRPHEIAAFRSKYSGKRDPYYSPHLSLDDERFAVKPRRYRPGPAPPVRALMCAFNLNWEGAPYSQLELTLGLKRTGCIEPIVYAPNDGPLRAAYEQAGIAVHVFSHPLAGVFDEAAYDRALDRFAEFLRGLDVEVVYGNTLQTFYAIDAARRIGLPTLWNPRESEPWQTYFNFLPAPLAARALRCFEYPYRIIFVAEATRKVFEPLNSRGNFTVIHNGLNLDRLRAEARRFPRDVARRELALDDGDIAIVLPGTVCERKGQHDLVEALSLLPKATAARLHCFIVGDRPSNYSVDLHRRVAELSAWLGERVQIVPETQHIARYYQAADVFVCTSRIESFPRVVLEAMAYGLPVISTRVFGIAEQVAENVNALLYEPGNAGHLAAQLGTLVDDDAKRALFAANSRSVLATLNTFDEMVAAYGTLFRECALSESLRDTLSSTTGALGRSRQPVSA